MNKIFFTIVSLFVVGVAFSQDIEVKKFGALEKDQTAVTNPRKDINGVTCGLVKVALKETGAEFEGNVMGDVEFTGKEYLVYLPNGTKRLGIKHPDYLPTTIVFADYGTKRVSSGITYQLTVKTSKKAVKIDNSKKGMAVFNIKPSNAILMIDGNIADGSGGAYTLSLPYGTHYYTVKLKDFSINNQIVKIDKNAKTIDVDLTEFFAKVNVCCKTEDAEIFVNGEQKGYGKWEGQTVPGKCIIEATKEGFHTSHKTMNVIEGETAEVIFSKLKAITGTLRIENELPECDVFLNGEYVGKTPWGRKDMPIGEYQVEIKHKYYNPLKVSISILEDQELLLNEKLSQTQMNKLLMFAEKGDPRAYCVLADLYRFGTDELRDADEWGIFGYQLATPEYFIKREQFFKEGTIVKQDIDKAIYWGKKFSSNYGDYQYEVYNMSEEFMVRYLLGEGVKQNYKESFFWACQHPSRTHEYWQAWHYFYGKGVPKNMGKAMSILKSHLVKGSINYDYYSSLTGDELFKALFESEGKSLVIDYRISNLEYKLRQLIERK